MLLELILGNSLALLGPPTSIEAAPDVYVLAGQSNMSGRGALEELSDAERAPDPLIRIYGNDGQWRIAAEPLDSQADQVDMVSADRDAGVGPGLFFARAIVRGQRRPVVLIPCAKGGSSVGRWRPGSERSTLYGSCLARIREAGGRVRGILWYQGETDAERPAETAQAWKGAFERVVEGFRKDLGLPALPVVFVQIGDRPDGDKGAQRFPSWTLIQDQQASLALPCTRMVPAKALARKPDGLHLATAGQRRLGTALATSMRALQPGCDAKGRT